MLRSLRWIGLSLLAACGVSSRATSPTPPRIPPATATVNATPSIAFDPSPATVATGGTVTFAFGAVEHNVFFDAASGVPADIPGTNANTSVARTFPTAGTFNYSCHIHPGMRGTILVSTAPTTTTGGASGY
jgi:plastocyanin